MLDISGMSADRERFIGPFIQSLRIGADMSQKELSDETGFSVQTISKIENSELQHLTVAAKRILKFLLEDIYGLEFLEAVVKFDQFCAELEPIRLDRKQ